MPGPNSIDEFKGNFHGGTRRNRFAISGTVYPGAQLTNFHAYAFSLPEVSMGQIPVDYRGRRLYIPGDRDYPEWTLTILDDAGGLGGVLYQEFQGWQAAINDHTDNVSELGANAGRQQWTIQHLDYNGNDVLKTFVLKGCWPVSVGAINLSAGSRDELVTFDVRVRFDYLEYQAGSSSADAVG